MRSAILTALVVPLVLLGAFVGGAGLAPSRLPQGTPEMSSQTSFVIATFNILGASHTDGEPGHGLGGSENVGWPGWRNRLPRALAALTAAGVSIAGLQEVHAPQSRALATTYSEVWGMFPGDHSVADKVIWDRTRWRPTERRLVKLPYFDGHLVDTPLVELRSIDNGQAVWVWSVHNPIGARKHRVDALRRQLSTVTALTPTGVPLILLGDFNDASDGRFASSAVLTPTLTKAPAGASIDHLYGANLIWLTARSDSAPQAQRISDHPMVTATWRPAGLASATP